ncbi:adhesion G protein-coupled receptor L4-like [Dysidea avara]|uniref:adhesion G protein-coupled receptor L4-like n=1 Tax=Dysidea avara TaxID=196820 RepID=UPI00332DE62C
MFINSNPLVIVYFTLNGSVTDDSTAKDVIEVVAQYQSLDIADFSGTVRRYNIAESEFAAISISFTLQVTLLSANIIETVKNTTSDALTAGSYVTSDDDIVVIVFQPNSSCSCDTTISPNAIQTVCTGPSTPPCKCTTDCSCNNPTYVGDGKVCGIDTDYDGFPDVNLNCDIAPFCEEDLCPDIYSTISGSSGTQQDASFCSQTVNATGCTMERDTTWNITWPATDVGIIAIQKCPGGSEADGLATRICIGSDEWANPDVSDCTTVEQIRLGAQIREIERIVGNMLSNETRDLTGRFESQVVTSIAKELNIVTNTSVPLVPNDVGQTNQTLGSILNVAESIIDQVGSTVVKDVVMDCTRVLSNLNDEGNDVSFQENETVSESLLMTTERVSILLGNTLDRSSNVTTRTNITTENIFIDAQLPTSLTAETITFPSDLSMFSRPNTSALQIVIPREAILYRFVVEGRNLPIVNTITKNSRLPTKQTQHTTSTLLSCQISTTVQERVPLGNETISFTTNMVEIVNQPLSDPQCAFWDFINGTFSNEGISTINDGSFVTCSSNHLTSFAVLVSFGDISAVETKALSIVTYIGCGISIVCLMLTMIIILLFRHNVFTKIHHYIHFNLSLTLLVGLIVFVSGIENATSSRVGCFIVAVLLHYFFIATFCWMLCEALLLFALLYFVFYQGFFNNWKFYTILGWGMPAVIVIISVSANWFQHYGSDTRCWISNENGAIWGFIGPMLLIIVINFGQYIMILQQVFRSKQGLLTAEETKLHNSVKKLLIAAMSLLPILGVTWVFGLLAVNDDTVVFAWIFTILNSLQGMFIFFFYIVRNDKLQKKLKTFIKESTASTAYPTSDTSSSSETSAGLSNNSNTLESVQTGEGLTQRSVEANATLAAVSEEKESN